MRILPFPILSQSVPLGFLAENASKQLGAERFLLSVPTPDEVLPRIREAIHAGAWNEIATYERELVKAFERAGSLADEARSILPGYD